MSYEINILKTKQESICKITKKKERDNNKKHMHTNEQIEQVVRDQKSKVRKGKTFLNKIIIKPYLYIFLYTHFCSLTDRQMDKILKL